jgi:hypothetical protein
MTVVASSSGILVRVRKTGEESIKEHRLYRIGDVCVAVGDFSSVAKLVKESKAELRCFSAGGQAAIAVFGRCTEGRNVSLPFFTRENGFEVEISSQPEQPSSNQSGLKRR